MRLFQDAGGKNFRYFPKIKYYYIRIDSTQTAFTTPCTATQYVTFNFQYEQYVTGLNAQALDPNYTSILLQIFLTVHKQ